MLQKMDFFYISVFDPEAMVGVQLQWVTAKLKYIKKLFEVPKNIHLWATSDNSGVGGKWKEVFIF